VINKDIQEDNKKLKSQQTPEYPYGYYIRFNAKVEQLFLVHYKYVRKKIPVSREDASPDNKRRGQENAKIIRSNLSRQ
jgi:hypothetical protein